MQYSWQVAGHSSTPLNIVLYTVLVNLLVSGPWVQQIATSCLDWRQFCIPKYQTMWRLHLSAITKEGGVMRIIYLPIQTHPRDLHFNNHIHFQSQIQAISMAVCTHLVLQPQVDPVWKRYQAHNFFGGVRLLTQNTPILQLGRDSQWDINLHLMGRVMPFHSQVIVALSLALPITIIMLDPPHLVFH